MIPLTDTTGPTESDDEFALWLARLNRDEVLKTYQRQVLTPAKRVRIHPVGMSLERAYQIADIAAERETA